MNLLEDRIVGCPYCGESVLLQVDCSVAQQRYVEDCSVCCRPMEVTISIPEPGVVWVRVGRDDE